MKKLISVILILIICISLFSCDDGIDTSSGGCNFYIKDIFPEGYTGGFPDNIGFWGWEYWWVESYEECLDAIELLKSHGSTFNETAIFTYEGDLFDTKFCFKINGEFVNSERINYGDNPFDRKAVGIEVYSYAFFDDVTIDEISYGDVYDLSDGWIVKPLSWWNIKSSEIAKIDPMYVVYELNEQKNEFYLLSPDNCGIFLAITSFGYKKNPDHSIECVKAVINSLEFIG